MQHKVKNIWEFLQVIEDLYIKNIANHGLFQNLFYHHFHTFNIIIMNYAKTYHTNSNLIKRKYLHTSFFKNKSLNKTCYYLLFILKILGILHIENNFSYLSAQKKWIYKIYNIKLIVLKWNKNLI